MNINELIKSEDNSAFDRFANHMHPQLARVLKTIGFDKNYVKAEGAYLFDDEGNKYLDFLSGYGVFALGRNHPKIKNALKSAIDADFENMVQMGTPTIAGVLAKKLLEKTNGLDLVFFTNSGAEANEGAIKFARKATGKNRIIYFDHAFHGLTTGALALNGNLEFKNGFGELLPGATKIPMGDFIALENELQKGDVAALFLEPIQGKGVNIASDNFYKKAEELCKKHSALIIADEVQSGFGRTGKWFSYNHWNLNPDIVTVAKALSGGFIPIGAIIYKKWIYDKVFPDMEHAVVHSNTFGRNTLAMAAGLATLKLLEDENVIENAEIRGKQIRDGISAMMDKYEMIGEVRGKGLMIGIEFKEPKSMLLKTGWKMIHKMHDSLFGQMIVIPLMRDHRILTQVAGHGVTTIKLLPPLIIGQEEVDYFLESFETVMKSCHKFPSPAWGTIKDLAINTLKTRNMT